MSEPMAPASVTAGSVTIPGVPGTTTWDGPSQDIRFHPSLPLAYDLPFTATLSRTVTDLVGNAMVADYPVSFTTAPDTTPPSVVSHTPVDGAALVPGGARISVTFSEAMAPPSLSTTTFTVLSGATPVAGAVSYDPATLTATFTPGAALSPGQAFTVGIATGATDAAGNALAQSLAYGFRTATAPVRLSTAATGWGIP
jgi:hypothetical protein